VYNAVDHHLSTGREKANRSTFCNIILEQKFNMSGASSNGANGNTNNSLPSSRTILSELVMNFQPIEMVLGTSVYNLDSSSSITDSYNFSSMPFSSVLSVRIPQNLSLFYVNYIALTVVAFLGTLLVQILFVHPGYVYSLITLVGLWYCLLSLSLDFIGISISSAIRFVLPTHSGGIDTLERNAKGVLAFFGLASILYVKLLIGNDVFWLVTLISFFVVLTHVFLRDSSNIQMFRISDNNNNAPNSSNVEMEALVIPEV